MIQVSDPGLDTQHGGIHGLPCHELVEWETHELGMLGRKLPSRSPFARTSRKSYIYIDLRG
jgi:hypothetical protein